MGITEKIIMKVFILIMLFFAPFFIQAQYVSDEPVQTSKAQDYKKLVEKYNRNVKVGMMITATGLVFAGTGFFVYRTASGRSRYKSEQTGGVLFLAGIVLINIGVPVSIVNGVKARKRYEAMTIELSGDGLSLCIKF